MNRNKNVNKKPKQGAEGKKPKEVEENIPQGSLNKADLRHIIVQGPDNDYAWYKNILSLFNDAANMTIAQVPGLLYDPIKKGTTAITPSQTSFTSPGVMSIRLATVVGNCSGPQDAPNIAAQQLYTMVTKQNSRDKSYDKTDLFMMILAVNSAYQLYEYLLRGYRSIGKFEPLNRYYPETLLRAQGFSSQLGQNLADFRGVLDLFAYQLGSINVPDVLDYIRRSSWLFSHVYKDAEDVKAQLYTFIPDGFYVWTEAEGSNPAFLKYVTREQLFNLTNHTAAIANLSQISAAINTIMTPLLGSSDIGLMNADIAKAYGDGNMIKIRSVSDYEAIEPVYDKEVLLEISNAFTPLKTTSEREPSATRGTVCFSDITQDVTNLVSGPQVVQSIGLNSTGDPITIQGKSPSYIKPILNFIDTEANADNIMVSTRLMTSMEPNLDGTAVDVWCGSEIVTEYVWWYHGKGSTTGNPVVSNLIYDSNFVWYSAQSQQEVINLSTSFDWSPAMYMVSDVGDTLYYHGSTIDLNNWIFVEDSDLRQLHDVAIMSLFAVHGYNYNS